MYNIDFNKPCHVYFMGIGGISMSGLAEILLGEGFQVSGSDMKESDITNSLKAQGVKLNIGQVAENITDDIDLVVYTAAIKEDNEEYQAVLAKEIPMLTRAQLLGQIMSNYKYGIAVSGTHGKTTTTAMMSHVLLQANTDPTISIGGMLDAIGGNIRVGHSDYFVTEACEYTNSFHSFNPYISIILNVDEDHLDFFSGIEEIAQSFKTFAEILPKDGLLVINGDMEHKDFISKDLSCNIVTFGLKDGNKYQAKDITFDEEGHHRADYDSKKIYVDRFYLDEDHKNFVGVPGLRPGLVFKNVDTSDGGEYKVKIDKDGRYYITRVYNQTKQAWQQEDNEVPTEIKDTTLILYHEPDYLKNKEIRNVITTQNQQVQ